MIDLWQEIYGTIKRNKLRTFLTGLQWRGASLCLSYCWEQATASSMLSNKNASERALNSIRLGGGWTTQSYEGLKEGRRIQLETRPRRNRKILSPTISSLRRHPAAGRCKHQLRTRIHQYLADGRTPELRRVRSHQDRKRTLYQPERCERTAESYHSS